MKLKTRMYLFLVCAAVLSAGSFTFLTVAYMNNFPTWSILGLLITVVLMIGAWGGYYITRLQYKDSLHPAKHHYGKGNRKNRRRGS